jgi:hypothetical protein
MAQLEILRHDWSKLKTQDSYADSVPKAIIGLAQAKSDQEASDFESQIDNVVILQGFMHEAALPTTTCIVGLLPSCSAAGRRWMLGLLFQFGNGKSLTSPDGEDLSRQCMREILYGTAMYFDILERGTYEEVHACIDLLILCAFEDRCLRARVDWTFRKLLETQVDESLREALGNGIDEIGEFCADEN